MRKVWDYLLNKFKSRRFLLILALVLAAAGLAVGAYLVLSQKSPRDFYLESEGKNFNKYSQQIKKVMRDFYNEREPYMSSRHKRRSEIAVDIKSESDAPFGVADAQSLFEILGRCKLITDSRNDPVKGESLHNISLLLERAPLIDASVFKGSNRIGFAIPVLMPDRYFTFNPENINNVYERFKVPLRPRRLFVSKADIAKAVVYSDEEFDAVAREYGKFISGFISEKEVEYGQNVTVKAGDEERKGREVIVTLDSGKTERLIKELADKAASDDILLKLTFGNYANVSNLLDEAGVFQLFDILDSTGYLKMNDYGKVLLEAANVRKNPEEFKDSLRALGTGFTYPEGLKMTVVIDAHGIILERKIDVLCVRPGEHADLRLNIHTGTNDVKNGNFNNGFLSIGTSKERPEGENLYEMFSINTKITPQQKNDDEKGTITINYEKRRSEVIEFSVAARLELDKNTDQATLKKNSILKYDVEIGADGIDYKDRISGEVSTTKWENKKQKTRNMNTGITVNAHMPSFNLVGTALKLTLSNEDRFDIDEFSLPATHSGNSVELDNISDDQLVKLQNEALASLGTFYLNNKPVIDALMK